MSRHDTSAIARSEGRSDSRVADDRHAASARLRGLPVSDAFTSGGTMHIRGAVLAGLLAVMSVAGEAQRAQYTPKSMPRTSDGRPNLNAPVPRSASKKPDLSGVWQIEASPIPELIKLLPGGENGLGEDLPNKHFIDIYADYDFGKEPLTPD